MSHKLGLILSMIIFLQSVLIALDISQVQQVNTRLTLQTNYLNSLIVRSGGVGLEVRYYVDHVIKGQFYVVGDFDPNVNDRLTYKVVVQYRRIYSGNIQDMSVTRSVLFGYTL